jgi:hypothetical protein
MTLDEALKAMHEGIEVTHEYLLHTRTKSLRIIAGGFYVDKEGYVLNPMDVMLKFKLAYLKEGWVIAEKRNTSN